MEVSQETKEDKLKINFKNSPIFFSLQGLQLEKTSLEGLIPVQLLVADAETIEGAGASFNNALTSFTAGNFFVNIIFAASLKYLWKMLDTLQLIVHLPMLAVVFPANAKFFF